MLNIIVCLTSPFAQFYFRKKILLFIVSCDKQFKNVAEGNAHGEVMPFFIRCFFFHLLKTALICVGFEVLHEYDIVLNNFFNKFLAVLDITFFFCFVLSILF